MKKTINILLVVAVIVPVVLLFWPFVRWNAVMSVILRVIPSIAMQTFLCRICGLNFVKIIPALLTGMATAWGTYLYFTSPSWSNATIGGLVADYVSPFISCMVVLAVYFLVREKK